MAQSTGRWAPVAPLTTVFTPPTSCLKDLYVGDATDTATLGQFDKQSECYPTLYWDEFWGSRVGYYSPGLCPSGYTSACGRQTSNVLGSGYTVGPSQISGETAVKCCPSNYVCHPTLEFYCSSKIATATTATTMSDGKSLGVKTVGTAAAAHAFGIQVRYQSSDLSILALAAPISTSQTPVDSPSPTKPASLPPTAPTSRDSDITGSSIPTPSNVTDSPSGLSQQAKIGIGVSIPLVLALLALLAFIFLRRRRITTTGNNPPISRDLPELHNTEVYSGPELMSQPVSFSHYTSEPASYKHPPVGIVEIASTKSPATDMYHPRPYENPPKHNNYFEAPSTVTSPTVFEAPSTVTSPTVFEAPSTVTSPTVFEAPSTVTSPTVFEADSSQHQKIEASELPAWQIERQSLQGAAIASPLPGYQIDNKTTRDEPEAQEAGANDPRKINDEISYLEAQQERMHTRRERLKQLEEIDEEESRIQERLANLRKL